MLYFQAQKKSLKKFELKSEKKKKNKNKNKTKRSKQSPRPAKPTTSEAHGEPITGSSLMASSHILNKKKKKTENRNRTHHVGACKNPITSLAWQRSIPITQYKSKPKSELSKPNN